MVRNLKEAQQSLDRLQQRLDQNAQERGEKFADSLISNTQEGKGLWLFWTIPVAFAIFLFFDLGFFAPLMDSLGASWQGWIYIGFAVSLLVAYGWFTASFTKRRPFISGVIAVIVLGFLPDLIK